MTEAFTGYFTVAIDEHDDFAIMFDVQQLEHKTITYIKYGEVPTHKAYDFRIKGKGSLEIKSSDPHYHKNGTYFIMVQADADFIDLFQDRHYSFVLQYRTLNTMPHLNSNGFLQVQTPKGKVSLFRHYVVDNEQDIRIAVVTHGHQELFVVADPAKAELSLDSADFSTKTLKGENYEKGKTLLVPMQALKAKNPACEDLGFADDNPCVLYVGLYCMSKAGEDCQAQIELEYDTKTPKRVYPGQYKHSIMANDSFTYYYMVITKEQIQPIFAHLMPLTGKAYMIYNVQRIKNDNNTNPDLKKYVSKSVLKQEMVTVTAAEQEACFQPGLNETVEGDVVECHVLFGIFPAAENTAEHLIFNFVASTGMVELQNKQPLLSRVKADEFAYFIYEETCDNCTMIVAISATTVDAVELYVNLGTKKPLLSDYHFMKTLSSTHMTAISPLTTPYFKTHNITSMRGHYILGVYGLRDTSFEISVDSEEAPVATVREGAPVSHAQKREEITYFQYYHWDQNDVEV